MSKKKTQVSTDRLHETSRAFSESLVKTTTERRISDSVAHHLWLLSRQVDEEANKGVMQYLAIGYSTENLPSSIQIGRGVAARLRELAASQIPK